MLFLLSCLLSYEVDRDRATIDIEQTNAVRYVSYKKGFNSSVKINSIDNDLISGHGSGNYFKIGREKFIMTAAHVISEAAVFFIEDAGEPVFLKPIYIDPFYDIALLIPHRNLIDVEAVDYRVNNKKDILGLTVNYTGHPSDFPKVMLSGTISHSSVSYAIMHSFAVPGASGSVVFDNSGRAIGVLSAVKIGFYGLSPFPNLEEDMVFLDRLLDFKRSKVKRILKLWRKSKN